MYNWAAGFLSLPGGGHYGFFLASMSQKCIDRIYFSQGAFDTDSDFNGTDGPRPDSNMIYNVSSGSLTTFPDPNFDSHRTLLTSHMLKIGMVMS